jgi:hypothetical protein
MKHITLTAIACLGMIVVSNCQEYSSGRMYTRRSDFIDYMSLEDEVHRLARNMANLRLEYDMLRGEYERSVKLLREFIDEQCDFNLQTGSALIKINRKAAILDPNELPEPAFCFPDSPFLSATY